MGVFEKVLEVLFVLSFFLEFFTKVSHVCNLNKMFFQLSVSIL